MSEWPYIVAAYAVTWTVLIGFTIYLAARDRAARRGTAARSAVQ